MAVTFDRWTKYPGAVFDNRPTTAYPGVEPHNTPGISLRYADGVTLQDCSVAWGTNCPPTFTEALETENVVPRDAHAVHRHSGPRWREKMKYAAILLALCTLSAADRPGTVFKIFQFPANMIPRIDGNADDWKMVPDDYAIGMDQLVDDTNKDRKPDPKDLDVKVKVGWVKGLNRLYFLYEAYDNYWDFAQAGPAQRHLRGGGGWRSLGRAADRALPAHQGTERTATRIFPCTACRRRTTTS